MRSLWPRVAVRSTASIAASAKKPVPSTSPSPNILLNLEKSWHKGVMRGRGLFCRKAPSLALPPEKTIFEGDSGEEAASLREAPPPQTPSPEERLAFELCVFSGLVPPESGGGSL